jgi:hypothetical protein
MNGVEEQRSLNEHYLAQNISYRSEITEIQMYKQRVGNRSVPVVSATCDCR